MRAFVPDMPEFFDWMEKSGHRYVVLRGFLDYENGYPKPGSKQDVDLLVDDAALAPIRLKYGRYKKRQGVKCDIYGIREEGYLGHAYLPPLLAERTLTNRRKWKNLFFAPGEKERLRALAYHIAYQKAERSGIDIDDPQKSKHSKYLAELGNGVTPTLTGLHEFLKREGFSIQYETLCSYLKNDFSRHVKSLFLARVCAEQKGEMNLFVIRGTAVSKGAHEQLLKNIGALYEVVTIKEIPFLTRLMKSGKMRGGKWRRGGRPHIAVVVFDSNPLPVPPEDQKIHPFVFNSRQFEKRKWREWFTTFAGSKPSDNPIHSTDNEAEAIGHLPLFFSEEEQRDIFRKLSDLRHGKTACAK